MNLPLLIESFESSARNLPGVLAAWSTTPWALRLHLAEEFEAMLEQRPEIEAALAGMSAEIASRALERLHAAEAVFATFAAEILEKLSFDPRPYLPQAPLIASVTVGRRCTWRIRPSSAAGGFGYASSETLPHFRSDGRDDPGRAEYARTAMEQSVVC